MPNLLPILLMLLVFVPSVVFSSDIPDIVLDSKIHSMKQVGFTAVIYPHKRHEELYQCDDCHPKIFIAEIGANDINMAKNMTQQYCGAAGCHNSAYAFPLYECAKCHLKAEAAEEKE